MTQFVITPNALKHIEKITEFFFQGDQAIAQKYYANVEASFFDLFENIKPRRASENLPEYVREINVKGFKGYTLRVAYIVGLVLLSDQGLPIE